MNKSDSNNVDIDTRFNGQLIPAIIQDFDSKLVLMLGYMNQESYRLSKESGKVTFFSRSKNMIWRKGKTSGNEMIIKSIKWDCDNDAILIRVIPKGPACHKGTDNCWGEKNTRFSKKKQEGGDIKFVETLINIIKDRVEQNNTKDSYVCKLFTSGMKKVAQKVGEEATELVIEAIDINNKDRFISEAADLLFHYLILIEKKKVTIEEVIKELKNRH